MKKYISLLLLLFPLLVSASGSGGFPSRPKFQSVDTAGYSHSTKSCAAGFTRETPNYCRVNSRANETYTLAVACGTLSFGAVTLPADAVAVRLNILFTALANNAVGLRTNSLYFFGPGDPTCLTIITQSGHALYEFSAVAAGTAIGRINTQKTVPLAATNTIRLQAANTGGNGNMNAVISVEGYFD